LTIGSSDIAYLKDAMLRQNLVAPADADPQIGHYLRTATREIYQMKSAYWLGGLVALVLAAGAAFLALGGYDVAADVPHWTLTDSVLERVRARSIARRSAVIDVPALDDPELITSGAGNYDAMCAGCHLRPGIEATEMSRGLHPAPPSLIERPLEDPAAAFWVIKHGLKMSGMPAWGKSMEDRYVWGLVAFLNELPGMPADRYRELVEASGGHQHGGSESDMEPEASDREHEPGGESHEHEHENSSAADDHSKAPPHQH
jgi:mono/diheme cytochrome c family protein